jgi:hypothetical protein
MPLTLSTLYSQNCLNFVDAKKCLHCFFFDANAIPCYFTKSSTLWGSGYTGLKIHKFEFGRIGNCTSKNIFQAIFKFSISVLLVYVAICFKIPVKSLNSYQIIVRDYFPMLFYRQFTDNFQKKIVCCSKQFVKHFTAIIGNLVRHFTINKQKCIQITGIFSLFLLRKYLSINRTFVSNLIRFVWKFSG